MKCAILTQSQELVNWDNVSSVSMQEGTYGEAGREIAAYAVLAYPSREMVDEDDYTQLGVYREFENCQKAFDGLISHINKGSYGIYKMPEEEEED